MFIRIKNGVPENYSVGQLRRDYPATSFPAAVPPAMLASYDVYALARAPISDYNRLTQTVNRGEPQQIDGAWTETWQVADLPAETALANLKAAREQAYKAEADPLFFKAQRGEADISEWQAKVDEIRARYPYPVV